MAQIDQFVLSNTEKTTLSPQQVIVKTEVFHRMYRWIFVCKKMDYGSASIALEIGYFRQGKQLDPPFRAVYRDIFRSWRRFGGRPCYHQLAQFIEPLVQIAMRQTALHFFEHPAKRPKVKWLEQIIHRRFAQCFQNILGSAKGREEHQRGTLGENLLTIFQVIKQCALNNLVSLVRLTIVKYFCPRVHSERFSTCAGD